MDADKEMWLRIQKERNCQGCLFFDDSRKGEMHFCTFAFRLEIEQGPEGEVCLKRREK